MGIPDNSISSIRKRFADFREEWGDRASLNNYFHAYLTELGASWRLGYDEAVNVTFFLIAAAFTVGMVLLEVLEETYVSNIRVGVTALFAIHLTSGLALVYTYSYRYRQRSKKETRRITRWAWRHLLAGYAGAWCLALFTLFRLATDPNRTTNGLLRVFFCCGLLLYLVGVFFAYRRYPADKIEGVLALLEIGGWTCLVLITGGAESHYLFLYYLTLVPVFRRGFPDRVRVREQERGMNTERVEERSLFVQLAKKFNLKWVTTMFFPIALLTLVQVFVVLFPFTELSGSGILRRLAQGYLNNAPWLLLLGMIAVLAELEANSLRIVSELNKEKVREDWGRRSSYELIDVVKELGLRIKENYIFKCSGLLFLSVEAPKADVKRPVAVEGYEINDVTRPEPRQLALESNPDVDQSSTFLLREIFHFHETASVCEGEEPTESFASEGGIGLGPDIRTTSYYYLKQKTQTRRWKKFIGPISRAFTFKEAVFKDAASLCHIVLFQPESSVSGASFTVAFFKSDVPGEFGSTTSKLYEALFTQVVAMYQKHKLLLLQEKATADERARTKAASGLVHNVRTLIKGRLEPSQSARLKFKTELADPIVLSLDKPRTMEELDLMWADYLEAAKQTKEKLTEIAAEFEREGAPADVIGNTLSAYFEYLRSSDVTKLDKAQLNVILEQVIQCLHSTWNCPATWSVPNERKQKDITFQEWSDQKKRLEGVRLASRPPDGPRLTAWDTKGQGIVQYRVGSALSRLNLPAGIIVQHILYELGWNSLKFGAERNILERFGARDGAFRIRLTGAQQNGQLCLRVSQAPCSYEELKTGDKSNIIDTLNAEDAGSDSKQLEARGLQGIRYLAKHYGWRLVAVYDERQRKLKVTLTMSSSVGGAG